MFGLSLQKAKAVTPSMQQIYMTKFAKTGSVKERFINAEGNVVEIFRPGLKTRLSAIGVESIQQNFKKNTAKSPIIDSVEIKGRVTEKIYKFENDGNDSGKAKREAFDFLRKGIEMGAGEGDISGNTIYVYNKAGYVDFPRAISLPIFLPKVVESLSISRISSTI